VELDRQRDERILRVERGSATIEGLAALAVAFLLLVILAQVAVALAARNAATAAVAATARRAALPDAVVVHEEARLLADIRRTVPGATDVEVTVHIGERTALAEAHFRWHPPGPALVPLSFRVRSRPVRSIPP